MTDPQRPLRHPPRRVDPGWGPGGDALLAELVRTAREQGWRTLTRTALRTRSFAARHVFAAAATKGALDYAGVLALVRGDAQWSPAPIPGWDRNWTMALGWVVGLQGLEPDDELVGARIFALAHAQFGIGALIERARFIYGQLLLAAGERARAEPAIAELTGLGDRLAPYLRADLRNPFGDTADRAEADPSPAGVEPWLVELNAILAATGTEPVALAPAGPTPFDRLRGATTPGSVRGPLVSVLVTCYRPDESLLTSLRSVLAQSWADLEVVLVDDASPPEYDGLLARCVGLDPRVRLIRQPVNGGTYLARNAGLAAARGEFVANQDSDDWAHPRRLERQVGMLLADPAACAVRGLSLRCDEALRFRLLGWDPGWKAVSTLVFRRGYVLERVGSWDEVRKSADSEFLDRLRLAAAAEGKTVLDLDAPVLFARLVPAGLSRAELSFGWEHEARRDYRMMFEHWHARLAASGGSAFLPPAPPGRPFPAPARFLADLPGRPPPRGTYDVVLAGDWRQSGAVVDALVADVTELTAQGRTVGLLQLEDYRNAARERAPMAQAVLDLVAAGAADWVHLDQGARADLLRVTAPEVLVLPPSTSVDLQVGQVEIAAAAAQAPAGAPQRAAWQAAEWSARDLFAVAPVERPTLRSRRRWLRRGPG